MNEGMINCNICGSDTPHVHDPDDVRIEREIRPTFEKWLRQWVMKNWHHLPDCRVDAIAQPAPADSGYCYPVAFGWGNLPKDKGYGNPGNIFYRAYYGAEYRDRKVEMFWRMYLALKLT